MPDALIAFLVFSVVLAVPAIMVAGFVDYRILEYRHKRRPKCECPAPRNAQIGDVFICPDCAWKWHYTWADYWTGWDWMPWWMKLKLKVGLVPKSRQLEPDPPPVAPEIEAKETLFTIMERNLRRVWR